MSQIAAFAGTSPQHLLFLFAAAYIAGCARGFSGFGGALIFIPLASTVIEPKLAVPILLLVDMVLTPGLIPRAWKNSDRTEVAFMALGAAFGVPAGTLLLAWSDPVTLRWIITVVVAALLALLASGWRYHGRPKRPLTIGVGVAAGICGGAAQVTGPPVVAYWLGSTIKASIVRANIVLFFAVSSLLSLTSYLIAGVIRFETLHLSIVIGPFFALGLYLGARLFGRASEVTFRRISFCLIVAAAVIGLPALDGILR